MFICKCSVCYLIEYVRNTVNEIVLHCSLPLPFLFLSLPPIELSKQLLLPHANTMDEINRIYVVCSSNFRVYIINYNCRKGAGKLIHTDYTSTTMTPPPSKNIINSLKKLTPFSNASLSGNVFAPTKR